jgi:hypothetical protein
MREHAEFVGHCDADACVAVIDPEGAVHREGGGVKEKADRFGVRLFVFWMDSVFRSAVSRRGSE